MIDKQHRIKNTTEFRVIRNSGKAYKHPLVTIITLPNGKMLTRIGIVAGKAVGGAVQRNLVKRRLRACVREQLNSLDDGWDIIIIARRQSGKVAFNELQSTIVNLLLKAGVISLADRQL